MTIHKIKLTTDERFTLILNFLFTFMKRFEEIPPYKKTKSDPTVDLISVRLSEAAHCNTTEKCALSL